ncbi:tripartite tricarboxylate transporter TctB family protein [Xinfangfangia pollutisoli]|uniref:tripartite tricarboxylate transporter TctB family protein n=1 Tax=Xinfangfangia pollutisoli TaxID=2865960 RepID=UPI001CD432F3|nr:tripartite tricarboxylate transporter TctB family protein [Xinfangfangia pollutisoli]
MQTNSRDLCAGLLFLCIGGFFVLGAWLGLRIGTTQATGPGFFPAYLGLGLCLLGGVIIWGALRGTALTLREGIGRVPWRGGGLVLAAILFFALAIQPLGALPAILGSTILAAVAPADATWRSALLTAAILTAFCVAVFFYALGLPYPLLGPWLSGR